MNNTICFQTASINNKTIRINVQIKSGKIALGIFNISIYHYKIVLFKKINVDLLISTSQYLKYELYFQC